MKEVKRGAVGWSSPDRNFDMTVPKNYSFKEE
jgi:hypothetical protein